MTATTDNYTLSLHDALPIWTGDAEIQRSGGRQNGERHRPRGAGSRRMSFEGGVAPSVLETLEFPAALERVAAHAAGPLGAARVKARTPATDPAAIRAALAQVAELAALLLTDDTIRAEPVPDLAPALELLQVAGSALEGAALAGLGRGLAAARVVAADLDRKSTRLNSSHTVNSYAVFCLKKKK